MKSARLSVLMVGLILLFGFAFGGVDQTFAQQQFIRGDADGDCLVGFYDAAYLYAYFLFSGPEPPCKDAGDLNDDSSPDIADYVYLLNYLFIPGAPPPPAPFPDPGFDPNEPDGLDCLAQCVPIDPVPSPVDFLTAGNATGARGETGVVISITATNAQNLKGYQIFLDYDENVLEATAVETTGTATGQAHPDVFDKSINVTEGKVEIVCIVDGAGVNTIPAGTNQLVKIIFSVKPDAPLGTTTLDLNNVIAVPFRGNLFTYAGGKLYPTLTDGDFDVVQHEFIRGDADGDCLVSLYDVVHLIGYVYGGPELPCLDAGDLNDDGTVNADDVLYFVQYLFVWGPPPAPPFPNPGPDPTEPDGLTCLEECVPIDPTPSPVDFLTASDASGSPGETGIVVSIIATNTQNLFGYQIFLDYDENILEATAVETTGTATGDAGADLFETFINDTDGEVEIACIVDQNGVTSMPAGTNQLVKITFSVKPDAPLGTTLLDLNNVIAVPFQGNLFTYAGGKLYPTLTDGNFTVEPEPFIISITDVGNDQGRQVRVNWNRCCYDVFGSPVTITEYSLWRRIDQDKAGSLEDEMLSSNVEMFGGPRLYPPGDWDFIKTVPARGEEEYNTVCPTLGDSTEAEGMYWSVFFVSAMTSDPLVYFDSEPDSGFSLDNIPPLPITDLDIPRKTSTALVLKWMVPGEYPGEQSATAYDIRYSTSPIGSDTAAWWDAAIQCEGEPYPAPAGAIDSFEVTLDLTQTYYIAMKLLDDRPNYSEISNIVRFTCGDANGSGGVDLADAVYIVNWLFIGGPPPDLMAAGDANCDSSVNLADAVYIINWLFIGGPPPCSP
jgi:hypothetical protein